MRMARRWLTPLMPMLMRISRVRGFVFRTISQTAFAYPDSPISAGSAGRVRAGDRLPWFRSSDSRDNYESLCALDWQVHVCGDITGALENYCAKIGLRLRQFPWTTAARDSGLTENGLYLVRPDGHVGLASINQDVSVLEDYLSRSGISPRR